MLRDKDPQVMVNAAVTLDEILRSDGRGNLDLSPSAGIQLNKKLALHLMERLGSVDQWGQCLLLDYLTKYAPDQDELFPFMVRGTLRCTRTTDRAKYRTCWTHDCKVYT